MQQLFSAILLGIATNLDNLAIGLSIGLEGKKLPFLSNCVIAASSALASYFGCALAAVCAGLGPWLKYLGGGLLVLLGLWPFFYQKAPKEEKKQPKKSEDGPRLGLGRALILAVTLALNCIPASFGAGMAGAYPWQMAASVGACSFLAVGAGCWVGRYTNAHFSGDWLDRAAAIIMVLLGIFELIAP